MEQGIERIDTTLREMFSNTSENKNNDDMITLTKAYCNYKKKYVGNLSFSPIEENLSKVTSVKQCCSIWFQLQC